MFFVTGYPSQTVSMWVGLMIMVGAYSLYDIVYIFLQHVVGMTYGITSRIGSEPLVKNGDGQIDT